MNDYYYISIRLFFQHVTSFQNICGIVYNNNPPIRFRFDGEPDNLSSIPPEFLDYKIVQIFSHSTYIYFKVEKPLYLTSLPIITLNNLLPLIDNNMRIYYYNNKEPEHTLKHIEELSLDRYAHSITIRLTNY